MLYSLYFCFFICGKRFSKGLLENEKKMNADKEKDYHLLDRECFGKWESVLGGAGFVIKRRCFGYKTSFCSFSWLKSVVLGWLLKESTISIAVGHVAPVFLVYFLITKNIECPLKFFPCKHVCEKISRKKLNVREKLLMIFSPPSAFSGKKNHLLMANLLTFSTSRVVSLL